MPDGDYELGGLQVTVTDDGAVLAGSPTLAGSLIGSADSFMRTRSWGWEIDDVVRVHTTTPAQVLGLRVALEEGARADVVAVDRCTHRVQRVMRSGEWLDEK